MHRDPQLVLSIILFHVIFIQFSGLLRNPE